MLKGGESARTQAEPGEVGMAGQFVQYSSTVQYSFHLLSVHFQESVCLRVFHRAHFVCGWLTNSSKC